MALMTYERASQVDSALAKINTENGFINITGGSFLGQIRDALAEAVKAPYGQLYTIAKNVDIGRAEGEYLDRWGSLLNEPRATISFAIDLSLNNVAIGLYPEVNAGDITVDALGISIPAGTVISSDDDTIQMVTIDDAYIRADRSMCYVRVISSEPGSIYVPPGYLTKTSLGLGDIDNVLTAAPQTYQLVASNAYEISGGTNLASDALYQYILKQKAASIGVFNLEKIMTLMDIEDIVNIKVYEYFGGVNVYIETRDPAVNDAMAAHLEQALRTIKPLGDTVNVLTPIQRRMKLDLQVELVNTELFGTSIATLKTNVVNYLTNIRMGETVSFLDMIESVKLLDTNIKGIRVREATYNNREVAAITIAQKYNEKLVIDIDDVTAA